MYNTVGGRCWYRKYWPYSPLVKAIVNGRRCELRNARLSCICNNPVRSKGNCRSMVRVTFAICLMHIYLSISAPSVSAKEEDVTPKRSDLYDDGQGHAELPNNVVSQRSERLRTRSFHLRSKQDCSCSLIRWRTLRSPPHYQRWLTKHLPFFAGFDLRFNTKAMCFT